SGRAVLALAAGHREAAGEPAAAAALWLRAAEAALAHNASREASDWAARSRAACDTCRAAMVHARALRRIGEVEASVRVSREAVALSGGAGAEASEAWADLAGILQLSSSAADVDHAARRAIELATDRPSWIRGGNALVPALIARGRTEEASRLGDELVEAAEAPGIPGTLATRCREVRAYTRYATRRYEEAIRDWEAAAESWKAAGDRFAYANALNNIAITENTLDRPEQAMARHREAERIRREIGDRLGLAISLTNISNVLHRLRDYDAALALAREALALRRSCGDVAGAGLTLGNIALIHRLQGRISEALAAMREAAQMRTISGNLVEFCDGLIHFARIHSDHGDPAAARECLAEARRSMKSLDRVDLQRSAIWTAIAVEDAHGTPAAGAELRRQYLALCPPEETTSDQVLTVLAGLFGSLLVLGRHDEAGEVLRQLEERARIDPAIHPLVHGLKARRAFDRDPAGAIREVAEAARLVRESGSAPAEFEFLTELVEFQCAAGDVDGAVRTGARIEDLARTLNLVEDFPILLAGARLRSLAAREQRGEALQMADGVLRDLDARGAVRQARSLRTLLGKLGLSDPTA
ncbi:MAG: tetratricopeptide repeat protein, partial [Candidatus Brocadiae bacterium]|nr:tetratricopeptide repeat protein [Candidatus Brocadiia bacterium]